MTRAHRRRSLTRQLLALVVAATLTACANDASNAKRYPLHGRVVSGEAAGQILIAHEAIDGYMPAMTMPFAVRGPNLTAYANDQITATLVVTDRESWIEDVALARGGGAGASAAASAAASSLVGRFVPNFRLRNHDDRPIETHGYVGRVVVLSFIYTRCPLPDYCPRMMRHLDAIKQSLEKEPAVRDRVQLIGVSFDPAYDTPARLREYGKTYLSGPDPFRGVDLATGDPAEVQVLAGFFGVQYFEEAGTISHSLTTAVIGADSRVAAVFPANTWTPDEALAAIRRALEVAS